MILYNLIYLNNYFKYYSESSQLRKKQKRDRSTIIKMNVIDR
jgi:hypothetical protein